MCRPTDFPPYDRPLPASRGAVAGQPECPVCYVPDSPEHRETPLHNKRLSEAFDAEEFMVFGLGAVADGGLM